MLHAVQRQQGITERVRNSIMLASEKEVKRCLDDLIYSIKTSNVYQNYREQEEKVNEQPDLRNQIDNFRRENFELQQNFQGEELSRKMDEFEQRYESFRKNPLVDKYLSAELAFCRMIQYIEEQMEVELDFK